MPEMAATATSTVEAPEWYTTADLAKKYRNAESTIRYWRQIGYGPKGTKFRRRVLYSADAVAAFDAQQKAEGSAA